MDDTSLPLLTSTQERAVKLLGEGVSPEHVASALGITASAISQIVSQPAIAERIAELRYANLQRHNERDSKYDQLEDKLLDQLEDLLPLMTKPIEILKAVQIINQAKRRGSSAPESIIQQNTHISLVMPTTIIQKFQTNINNQVVVAGGQELTTIQSKLLLNTVRKDTENDNLPAKEVSRIGS